MKVNVGNWRKIDLTALKSLERVQFGVYKSSVFRNAKVYCKCYCIYNTIPHDF